MSIFPDTPLADRVRKLIIETFEVSDQEASEHARRLVALADGWGESQTPASLDWAYRAKKELGEKLKWRSETERKDFKSDQNRKFAAYEEYISNHKRRTE